MNYIQSVDEIPTASIDVRRPASSLFTVARYLLDGPVLPSVIETLPLAEQARRALMSKYEFLKRCERYGKPNRGERFPQDAERFNSPAFTGKDAEGQPLRDDRGAFFLPADEDGDGRLDHITIYAKAGLGTQEPDEIAAIDALRTLRFNESDLSLRLTGLGNPEDFPTARTLAQSRTWESATPFLVTRHLKSRGQKRDPKEWLGSQEGLEAFTEKVLREALQRRGLQEPKSIKKLEAIGPNKRRPTEFRLFRQKQGDDGGRRRKGLFRIEFQEPIQGPIALGHSNHFGLGLFLGA